jgi:hypothetical protein
VSVSLNRQYCHIFLCLYRSVFSHPVLWRNSNVVYLRTLNLTILNYTRHEGGPAWLCWLQWELPVLERGRPTRELRRRLQVLTAASVKMRALWDIAPWLWRHNTPLKRRYTTRLRGAISQKALIFLTTRRLDFVSAILRINKKSLSYQKMGIRRKSESWVLGYLA